MKISFLRNALVLVPVLLGCQPTDNTTRTTDTVITNQSSPPPVVASLRETADAVLQELKSDDYKALRQRVHPEKGILFSPYGYVDTAHSVRMTPAEFEQAFSKKDSKKWYWGVYDGSGDSILLTPQEYQQKFVFDRNYLNADSVLENQLRSRGNTLNNLKEAFPEAEFVEYYTAGKMEMDWSALKLVFEKYQGKYFLVGMVHDAWTI